MFTLSIENLGILKEAELKITPFTLIIGENNTNKSWAAYSLYGILHDENRRKLVKSYMGFENEKLFLKSPFKETIKRTVEKVVNSPHGFEEVNLEEIWREMDFFWKDLSKNYSVSFIYDLFGIEKESELFKRTNIQLFFEDSERMIREVIENKISVSSNSGNREIISLLKESGSSSLFIEIKDKEEIPKKFLKIIVGEMLLALLTIGITKRQYLFPSERKALATVSEKIQRKMSELKDTEIPFEVFFELYFSKDKFPKYMEDFIHLVSKLRRESHGKMKKLLSSLEKIAGGSFLFDSYKQFITFYSNSVELPVYSTSSLVKSLSTFYLYLQKLSTGRDLIILDEPEMNLHPKGQVAFLEIFTAFVNEGENNFLVATTHTPYLLEHLENLMEGFQLKKRNRVTATKGLFTQNESAWISPSKVSCYYFSPAGKVESILDRRERSINWESFSSIATKISQIGWEIEELKERESSG